MSPKVTVDWLSAPPSGQDDEQEPKAFLRRRQRAGKVINLIDEMLLWGAYRVQLPFIDDIDLSPWARIAVPMSGIGCGMSFLPQVGDEVLVAFEQGDVNVPYVIGSLWNGTGAATAQLLPVPDSPVRTSYIEVRTRLPGNQIVMVEAPPPRP